HGQPQLQWWRRRRRARWRRPRWRPRRAAVIGGDAMNNDRRKVMKPFVSMRMLLVAVTFTVFPLAITPVAYAANDTKSSAAKAKAVASQQAFPTPDALFQALADAAKTNDSVMLVALRGSSGDALMNSGDAVADKQRAEKFASDYAEKHSVTMEGDSKATLLVGKDDWPMPIPAVKSARGWMLDASAGAREMLARRIG